MPKRGSRRKKTKTHEDDTPEGAKIGGEGASKANDVPRSLVVRANKVVSDVSDLIIELRRVMSPNTASNLRERRWKRLICHLLILFSNNISHFC